MESQLNIFLTTFMYATLTARCKNHNLYDRDFCTMEELEDRYQHCYALCPKIFCKDGFNIPIQIGKTNCCCSENGYCTFGFDWKKVEWGYPSMPIDKDKYHCNYYPNENEEVTNDITLHSTGSASIEEMEELLAEHGGFDLQATLRHNVLD